MVALLLFLAPAVLLFPLKLLALWLIGEGRAGLGVCRHRRRQGARHGLRRPALRPGRAAAHELRLVRAGDRLVARDQGADRRAGAPVGAVAGGRGRCAGAGWPRARTGDALMAAAHPSSSGRWAAGASLVLPPAAVAPRAGAAAAARRHGRRSSTARTASSGRRGSSASAAARSSVRLGAAGRRSSASCRSPSRWRIGMPANERMDALVEKATELGAAAIQPLVCERSVRAPRRRARRGAAAALAGGGRGGQRAVRPGPRAADRPADAASTPGCEALAAPAAPGGRWLLSLADGAAARRRCAIRLAATAPPACCVLSGPEGGLDAGRGGRGAARAASCRSRSARACCAPTPRRWRCSPGSAWPIGSATE